MSRRGPIVAAVASGLVALLAVMFFVLPKMNQVKDVQDQLDLELMKQDQLQVELKGLQEAQANAPETKKQIQQLENEVPPTADQPALVRLLREASDRAAVDFFTVSFANPTADTAGSFSVVPASITVTGRYFTLDEFLFRLETLLRAAKVTAVSITPGAEESTSTTTTGGSPSLTMTLTVEFYTTDSSAGPASFPGPTSGATSASAPAAAPTASPTPGA